MRVRWLRSTLRDLEAQIEYIATNDPKAAARVSDRIRAATERLADFPEMGRVGRVASTRELVIARSPWIVVYRVANSVEILRIIHSSQRWPPRT
jgi:toxin ParE1/3/4